MLGSLLKSGVEITNDATLADAVIINTCSFIDSAQEESVDTILESDEVREAKNRGQSLIVSGCLPQRFREELPKLLPEVDAFMGIDQVAQVSDIVRQAMARRAARLVGRREARGEGRKRKAMKRLSELDQHLTATSHEESESLRGKEKFGRTKTVVNPQSAIRNHRFWMLPGARPSFPILPRHAFASHPGTLPMLKSPRAAIIRAASASSPGCGARIAAGRRWTSWPKSGHCWPMA